jgi:hypothetical protein
MMTRLSLSRVVLPVALFSAGAGRPQAASKASRQAHSTTLNRRTENLCFLIVYQDDSLFGCKGNKNLKLATRNLKLFS